MIMKKIAYLVLFSILFFKVGKAQNEREDKVFLRSGSSFFQNNLGISESSFDVFGITEGEQNLQTYDQQVIYSSAYGPTVYYGLEEGIDGDLLNEQLINSDVLIDADNYIQYIVSNDKRVSIKIYLENESFDESKKNYIVNFLESRLNSSDVIGQNNIADRIIESNKQYYNFLVNGFSTILLDDQEQVVGHNPYALINPMVFLTVSGVPVELPQGAVAYFMSGNGRVNDQFNVGLCKGMLHSFNVAGSVYSIKVGLKEGSDGTDPEDYYVIGYADENNVLYDFPDIINGQQSVVFTSLYLGFSTDCSVIFSEVKYEFTCSEECNLETGGGSIKNYNDYYKNVIKTYEYISPEGGEPPIKVEVDPSTELFISIPCEFTNISPHLFNEVLDKGHVYATTNYGKHKTVIGYQGEYYLVAEHQENLGDEWAEFLKWNAYTEKWIILDINDNLFLDNTIGPIHTSTFAILEVMASVYLGVGVGQLVPIIAAGFGSKVVGMVVGLGTATVAEASLEYGFYTIHGDEERLAIGLICLGAGNLVSVAPEAITLLRNVGKKIDDGKAAVEGFPPDLRNDLGSNGAKEIEIKSGIIKDGQAIDIDQVKTNILDGAELSATRKTQLAKELNKLEILIAFDKNPNLVKAWDALKKTGLRTDVDLWLPTVSKWIDEGVTYVDDVLPVKFLHNGNEIARIVDDKLIPTKFQFDGTVINEVKLPGQTFGKDVVKASDGTIGFRYQFQKTKIYRAMSDAEWQAVQSNNGLSIGNGTENFVSTSKAYSEGYIGQPGYDVLVEFTVQPKTVQDLAKIGVKDQSNLIKNSGFDDLTPVSSGWSADKAFFKGEGTAVNIGLGAQSVNTFNGNITTFVRLN